MTLFSGVNLLPASGEWVYDTVPHRSQQVTQVAPVVQNLHAAPAGTRTDYSFALDQLQAQHPECTTVSLIVAWFGSSADVTQCKVYPSTTYIGGGSDALVNGADGSTSWTSDPWRCSGLTQDSAGLIPISQSGGSFVYGGTPADGAVVRCIRDLRGAGVARGLLPLRPDGRAGLPLARAHRVQRSGRVGCGEPGCRRLHRHGGALAVHARPEEHDGGLFRCADRLHLSPHDPALRQPLRGCRRRRPIPARLRTARAGKHPRAWTGPRPARSMAKATPHGTTPSSLGSRSSPPMSARCSMPLGWHVTWWACTTSSPIPPTGRCGWAFSTRSAPVWRTMAASRCPLRRRGDRLGVLRQLPAAVRLDERRWRARRAELVGAFSAHMAAEPGDHERA